MMPKKCLFWISLSTLLVSALVVASFGARVQAAAEPADDSDFRTSLDAFTRVYQLVELNYADPVDPDTAIFDNPQTLEGAIPGMLRTLDPHSIFFDPRAFSRLREDQEGRYSGVGMSIGQQIDKLGKVITVVGQPMPDSPALRAGLRPGDVIIRVDGKSTDGLGLERVAALLKGPKGTTVHVTVTREGSPRPLDFAIVRQEILHRSIDRAFPVSPGVAYIRIVGFTETTNDELVDSLKKLDVKSFQGLILDLRGNRGGLLKEAVDVADHFLEKNQLIVYHFGRNSRKQLSYATKGNNGYEYPLVVLIDRDTASAAEIVTGALQDHDRALVIGEPSFGKGLVQTVYPLSEHTGLALTTARYYTPSGRLIQRDYSDVSLYDYYWRFHQGVPAHAEVRLTDGGREVYGGGGITPDVTLPDATLNPFQSMLQRRAALVNFGNFYLLSHHSVPRDFVPDEKVIEEFRSFLATQKIPVSDQELNDNLDFIRRHIRVQLVGLVYGQEEGDRVGIESDPAVLKALEEMCQAKELVARARRTLAGKNPPGR